MMGVRKAVVFGMTLALAAVATAIGLFARQWSTQQATQVEVGVLFPGTDEGNWLDFVEGVRLAAREAGLSVSVATDRFECMVATKPTPVRFRWYPAAGGRGIQRRVRELCDRPTPPLAVVGANNSALTRALAEELAARRDRPDTPVLLMTSATADNLIQVHAGRSFRFGFNNSFQARTVVRRYREYVEGRGGMPQKARVLLIQIKDDPFSVDLARRFYAEVKSQLDAIVVGPDESVKPESKSGVVSDAPDVWSLTTATGSFDDPSEGEWWLARQLVSKMTSAPDAQWVLVMPMGTAAYRRMAYALHQAFQEADAESTRRVRANLVALSGDSLGYYRFHEAQLNQLLPDETPAPVIFFSHTNPVDPAVPAEAPRDIPSQSLNRDVARTLFAVLPSLGSNPTAAQLTDTLARYRPAGESEPMFDGGERRRGGGAVIAVPKPDAQRFELLLRGEWQVAP
jgi:hypothetical protein